MGITSYDTGEDRLQVREIAQQLGAPFEGDGARVVNTAASVEAATIEQIAFAAGPKALQYAASSSAGCLLIPLDLPNPDSRTVIRVPQPRAAFARVIALLHPPFQEPPGVDPSAIIASTAFIGEGVSIGPRAVVGERSIIGARSVIGAGSVIGRGVQLGERSRLQANVTIYDNVIIGRRAVLHSGCVLGADGFGFVPLNGRWEKFPQIGTVEIGDDVEIGANTCVDRAALGATTIGDGTKLDNLVHVAHNCSIGRHVVVAAQTGFSGGVVVEDYAVIGGQVGIGDKARIESRAVLGSGCGVLTSKIIRSGQTVWGTPARPLKEYLETLAVQAKLPEHRKRLRALEERIAAVESRLPSE
jgi:UDP-3-O-[3-hydroxymyristoyl] glucosamine N-acyltransferase